MKKILAICTSPDHGGLEIYFTSLAKYFNNKSNDVLIYPCFSKNSYIGTNLKDSVNHYLEIKNIKFFNILKYAFVISRYIQKHNINYIHISWGKDLLLGVLIKKLCKDNVKLIYYRQMKVTRNKHDIYHKFIYRNIDLVLVITENTNQPADKITKAPIIVSNICPFIKPYTTTYSTFRLPSSIISLE